MGRSAPRVPQEWSGTNSSAGLPHQVSVSESEAGAPRWMSLGAPAWPNAHVDRRELYARGVGGGAGFGSSGVTRSRPSRIGSFCGDTDPLLFPNSLPTSRCCGLGKGIPRGSFECEPPRRPRGRFLPRVPLPSAHLSSSEPLVKRGFRGDSSQLAGCPVAPRKGGRGAVVSARVRPQEAGRVYTRALWLRAGTRRCAAAGATVFWRAGDPNPAETYRSTARARELEPRPLGQTPGRRTFPRSESLCPHPPGARGRRSTRERAFVYEPLSSPQFTDQRAAPARPPWSTEPLQ